MFLPTLLLLRAQIFSRNGKTSETVLDILGAIDALGTLTRGRAPVAAGESITATSRNGLVGRAGCAAVARPASTGRLFCLFFFRFFVVLWFSVSFQYSGLPTPSKKKNLSAELPFSFQKPRTTETGMIIDKQKKEGALDGAEVLDKFGIYKKTSLT